tara:strand:- start:178 stop:471 length:294 start_codon:yes stop_codon:yes gene_type:complete
MIRNLAMYLIFLGILNGCAQGLAFLGPAYSYSKSGSVVHSALSYGSNLAFNKMKDKSSTKNNEKAFDDDKIIYQGHSFSLVKNKIESASGIINLANQ